jgi:hypothetical protein
MIIYAVFADMEHDIPVAYCADEDDAKFLLGTNWVGDVIPLEVEEDFIEKVWKSGKIFSPISEKRVVICDYCENPAPADCQHLHYYICPTCEVEVFNGT